MIKPELSVKCNFTSEVHSGVVCNRTQRTSLDLNAAKCNRKVALKDVIVRPLSTVGYTSVVASVIHSRQWSN